jgi:ABC transport system ATP-binding/permease protein
MRIVLAEECEGRRRREFTFEQSIVKIGRDPDKCLIVFDRAEWPMVSRQHAEFRRQGSQLLLADTNSRFGTFLNGERMQGPAEVQAGALVQFGLNGPVIRVVHIEDAPVAHTASTAVRHDEEGTLHDMPASVKPTQSSGAAPKPENSQRRPTGSPAPSNELSHAASAEPAVIECVNGTTGNLQRIRVDKEVIYIGRSPEMDIIIEAAETVVSRRHAMIKRQVEQYVLFDLGSFNGTLINGQRITQPTPLYDGDHIHLGVKGPVLSFIDPLHRAPADALPPAGQRALTADHGTLIPAMPPVSGPLADMLELHQTLHDGSYSQQPQKLLTRDAPTQLLMQLRFDGKRQLTVGRALDNDITLDGLQISKRHARFLEESGRIIIEDVGSTNGVYVNGTRVKGKRPLDKNDLVQIGPFLLQADTGRGIAVFDTRSKARIDAIDITKVVPNRSGGGETKLLDDVDLTIMPNEFVGLLGPSGAGKSTLMDALNGMRRATSGQVLINHLDLYQHLDSLKQSIGYVPQEDIVHRELTVYRTLYYVARLRLSGDVSDQEIDQIVNEVIDVTGLAERRELPVGQLSGGQRKRVSIAVELVTKPSIIFLDEPTSGLDPATEGRIMKLFRQIADNGRTVILTTHAVYNIKLFDKLVIVLRGKMIFYGSPQEALAHFEAESFDDLYEQLETPSKERVALLTPLPVNAGEKQKRDYKLQMELINEEVAEEWKQRFIRTEQYQLNIVQPLSGLRREAKQPSPAKQRWTIRGAVRQWLTLTQRYLEVLARDRLNLLILLGQAPIIGIVVFIMSLAVAQKVQDFPYSMLGLVPMWFGTSVAAREIIRERAIYNRERMVNLELLPYVASKLFVLLIIVGLQCVLMFGTLSAFKMAGLLKLTGSGTAQLLVMILTGAVGIALGLFISALVKTSEMATSLVPLVLIPQIVFSGIVNMPTGPSKFISTVIPVAWSFDEMKRLSGLDTFNEEGSNPNGPNQGRGLIKHIKQVNEQRREEARQEYDKYRKAIEDDLKEYEQNMKNFLRKARTNPTLKPPPVPTVRPAPEAPKTEEIPEDLSGYVLFLHTWGGEVLNPLILLLMFFLLLCATASALRLQDIN